jgi:drug/metabolite transporter (DMT)-like permease
MFKTKLSDTQIGLILTFLATALLAVRAILVKYTYAEQVPVLELFYYRFLIALPLIWAVAIISSRHKFKQLLSKKTILHCALAGFFGYYLATLSDFYSLELIDASVNRIILYSFPIYVIIIQAIISKKLPAKKFLLAFILLFSGIYLVMGGNNKDLFNLNLTGALLALIAAISYAIYIMFNQQTGKKIGSILFTTIATSFSFLYLNIQYFFFYQPVDPTTLSTKGLLLILAIAVFCTFMPLLMVSEGIKRLGATRLSILNMSGPVMTLILAYFFLNEILNPHQILGAAIVLFTLYLLEKKPTA